MARTNSPLRYPGGKSCLYSITGEILHLNSLERGHYAEPYAGGCGLALSLLYGGYIAEAHINDLDKSIWSFWNAVLHENDELIDRILQTPVTVDEWQKQRDIYRDHHVAKSLDLAFATFYLNRTNRSGIIKGGGVIGGINQTGPYKIDCRYNIDDLVRRIRRVQKYSDRIHLTNMDALDFMSSLDSELPERSLWFVDPPYYKKGADLYTSFYRKDDHARVADTVAKLEKPWVVTYDNQPEISRFYNDFRQYEFNISYSVAEKRLGTELLIAADRLQIPDRFGDAVTNFLQTEAA